MADPLIIDVVERIDLLEPAAPIPPPQPPCALRLSNVAMDVATSAGTSIRALESVYLSVAQGEFVALLGPSGCGKSSLLKLAAGLAEPTMGRVTHGGGANAAHAPAPWVRRQGLDVVTSVPGVHPWAAISRALVRQPKILLLDEPFRTLDDVRRQEMDAELHDLCARDRVTTLLATDSVEEAVFLADRVLVMSDRPGRIETEYTIALDRPRRHALRQSAEFHRMVDVLSGAGV